MSISAVRLMSLIAEAVKTQPQAKADPAKADLIRALAQPALPPNSTSGTRNTPILPSALPLHQAMRLQQDGSAAVLRAYGFTEAAASADIRTDEPGFNRLGNSASDPLPRTDLPPAGPRAPETAMPNRLNPVPLHGFVVFVPSGQADAVSTGPGKGAAQKGSKRDMQAPTEKSPNQKMSFGLIVTATAVVAVMMLAR